MDLSKLPKLSNTTSEQSPPAPLGEPPMTPIHVPVRASPAEAWLSIAVGAILLLIQPRLIQFIMHKLFGTSFAPFLMPDGTEVPYTSQPAFWSDLGVTMFALVLVLQGILLAMARHRMLVAIALVLTIATTLYNLGYLFYSFSNGLAIVSALAVAFGVYIAMFEWNLLNSLAQQNARHAGKT